MYVFCINAYNDLRLLKDCIYFIRQQKAEHKIVIVDGAYALFPHFRCPHCAVGFLLPAELPERRRGEPINRTGKPATCLNPKCRMQVPADIDLEKFCMPHSTDGTLEFARENADIVVDAPGTHWPSEYEKRNAYLAHGKPGDWFFVLDADERLIGELPTADSLPGTDYAMEFIRPDLGGTKCPYHRLFKNIGRIRYEGWHYALMRDDELVTRGVKTMPRLPGISVIHMPLDRTTERVHLKGYYYRTGLGEIQARRRLAI